MPKQKTHSGAKKRFKITGSGKLKKQQAGMRHNLEHKSSRRTRRLNQDTHRQRIPATLFNPQASFASCGAAAAAASCPSSYSASYSHGPPSAAAGPHEIEIAP